MSVVIYERNLMWGVRLRNAVQTLGVPVAVREHHNPEPATLAIINLSDAPEALAPLIHALKAQGTYVLGHAGHKEKPLHRMGNEWGCNYVATNSEIANKLPQLLAQVPALAISRPATTE
jgi:hypothetical protein